MAETDPIQEEPSLAVTAAAPEPVAHTETVDVSEAQEGSAAVKLMRTLRALSEPAEDAGELMLMLATVAMALESNLGKELVRTQTTGELDEFLAGMARWIAWHRSESTKRLVVVELPRRPAHDPLPNGVRLHLLTEAERLAETANSPLL